MTQKEVLEKISTGENAQCLDNIAKVHNLTKHYLLLAEELSEEGVCFLQPLKEHRDSYDHLMRIFFLPHKDNEPKNCDSYITSNINKAFGHEYRAFFDTADWLTYICRKYIRQSFEHNAVRDYYKNREEEYIKIKTFINELPHKIAEYREKKDVDDNKTIDEVLKYKQTLDELIEIYDNIKSI